MSKRQHRYGQCLAALLLFLTGGQAAQYEDDSCSTKSIPGVCRRGSQCTTLEPLIKQGVLTKGDIVRCGFALVEEIICCPTSGRSGEISSTHKPTNEMFTFDDPTTSAAIRDFRSHLLSTTSTAKPDSWLESNTTTTSAMPINSATTASLLKFKWKELKNNSEFFDFSKLIITSRNANNDALSGSDGEVGFGGHLNLPSNQEESGLNLLFHTLQRRQLVRHVRRNADSNRIILNNAVFGHGILGFDQSHNAQLNVESTALNGKLISNNGYIGNRKPSTKQLINDIFDTNLPERYTNTYNNRYFLPDNRESSIIKSPYHAVNHFSLFEKQFEEVLNSADIAGETEQGIGHRRDDSMNHKVLNNTGNNLNIASHETENNRPNNINVCPYTKLPSSEQRTGIRTLLPPYMNYAETPHTLNDVEITVTIPTQTLLTNYEGPKNAFNLAMNSGIDEIETELSSFEQVWARDQQINNRQGNAPSKHNYLDALSPFQLLKPAANQPDNTEAYEGTSVKQYPDNHRSGRTTTSAPNNSLDDRPAVRACRQIEANSSVMLTFHIIDGTPAELGEYPHMAAIGFKPIGGDDGPPYNFKCGGTLIDKRFVLTAAHCVNSRDAMPVIVRMGVTDFKSDEQMKNVVERRIIHSYIHPNYSLSRTYNDIAVLELDRDVEYTNVVRPTCLYTSNDELPLNSTLFVTGWGTINITTRETSNILLQAQLSPTGAMECNQTYFNEGGQAFDRKLDRGLLNTQLCAVDRNATKDACQGDSGGPLNLVVDKSSFRYRVAGVISTGFSCGSHVPGIFTRVSAYLDYIERIVWPNL